MAWLILGFILEPPAPTVPACVVALPAGRMEPAALRPALSPVPVLCADPACQTPPCADAPPKLPFPAVQLELPPDVLPRPPVVDPVLEPVCQALVLDEVELAACWDCTASGIIWHATAIAEIVMVLSSFANLIGSVLLIASINSSDIQIVYC